MLIFTIIIGILALILIISGAISLYTGGPIVPMILGLVLGVIWFMSFLSITKVELSEQRVSGIVYNTQNNIWPLNNTTFSVRASENTYIYHDDNGHTNESSYCLPPNSPYIKLVNEAAENKSIKVIVTTQKIATFVNNPFTCVANVKVERLR